MQALHLDTAAFTGDVLLHNNEICGTAKTGAVGGMSIVDVTNPKNHRYLAQGFGDLDPVSANGPGVAHTIHSVFGRDAGDRAYAVMVDNEEAADVDIVDITDPAAPVLVAEHDLAATFPQILQKGAGLDEVFLHDMVVKQVKGRWLMLLSYWDAGYVVLDVTDPVNPTYVADSDYASPDPEAAESGLTVAPEGNAHQAEFSPDNRFIVAADEDFSPFFARGTNTDEGGTFATSQGSNTPAITEAQPLQGRTRFVGRACAGDAAVPAGDGTQIAVVARGLCTFTEKVAAVTQAGGYVGAVVYNREGSDACSALFGMSVEGSIPTVSVSRDVGFGFFDATYDETACRAASADAGPFPAPIGTVGDAVRIGAGFDGWGYVRLFRNERGKLTELDTYAIPEAHDRAYAAGFGDLSVHEVATSERDDRRAYLSYYSGGLRVVRITRANTLEEVGHYVAPEGSNVWGVQVWQKDGREYVLASDRDFGLLVFEYTGP